MLRPTCYAAALAFAGTFTPVAAAQTTIVRPALEASQPTQENDPQFAWDLLGLLGLAGLFGLRHRLPRSLRRQRPVA